MCNSARTQSEIISYRGGFGLGFKETNRILPGGEEHGEGHFRTSEIPSIHCFNSVGKGTHIDINFGICLVLS